LNQDPNSFFLRSLGYLSVFHHREQFGAPPGFEAHLSFTLGRKDKTSRIEVALITSAFNEKFSIAMLDE